MGEVLRRRVEVAANIALIAVATLGCAVLSRQLLFSPAQTPTTTTDMANRAAQTRLPTIGAHVSLPGIEWTRKQGTLLLVLSTKCHFCSDSAPFYRRLTAEARRQGRVGVVAVLPQPRDESSKFLAGLGVEVDNVLQAPIAAVGTRGTPTLVLVDKEGVIRNSWIGRLPSEREAEVLGAVGAKLSE